MNIKLSSFSTYKEKLLAVLGRGKELENRYVEAFKKDVVFSLSVSLVACMLLVMIGSTKSFDIISPLVASFKGLNIFSQSQTYKTFAFAPSGSPSKLAQIDFNNLSALAYYDIRLAQNGTINQETDSYYTFKSDVFAQLVQDAKVNDTKVYITLSSANRAAVLALLGNKTTQQEVIEQVVADVQETHIHGVVIDFEVSNITQPYYRTQFTTFVKNLTNAMHAHVSSSQVAVALWSGAAEQPFYDIAGLSESADMVFAMSYDVAVPEENNGQLAAPKYGYNEDTYWNDMNKALQAFADDVPQEKLFIERAWYGHGEFPFYQAGAGESETKKHRSNMATLAHAEVLDEATIEQLVAGVPQEARAAARKNLPYIAAALKEEGILNQNVLAYALATIEHETAGTFEPIEEYSGRQSARRLGYEGSSNYLGRGFIQLTHLRNYKMMGERIGMGDELVRNPELALTPEVSARILAAFFADNGVSALASNGNFIAARLPINPDANGGWIASLAYKYL